MEKIVVVGAGSWGNALALTLAKKNSYEVYMWEYNKERAEELEKNRENELLPGVKFPDNLHVTNEKNDLLKDAKVVVFSIPSQALRGVVAQFSDQMRSDLLIVNTGKGLEISTGMRLSEVIKDEILGKYHNNIVVLSGPTHAEEVALNLPTTIVAAGKYENAKKIQEIFNTNTFRVYVNEDMLGVELGGAVKNCLALGAGIADGMGFGDNTKAALITRGIKEMIRFGERCGANPETFNGLAGIGDLIVTCASKHSRNRYVGEKLGKGEKLSDILKGMKMVAEGVPTVKAVYEKAKELQVSMPITEAIYKVIYEDKKATEMVEELMTRELKEEF
ncbi:NAD(P)H-dependent glycerol-3-phosphate dehydrogenase [Fusobacterium perfoetens]|uniref:NAD(P)H-dependent glycerol-3-phosphate dehydrogenase n=1 Tax=Fusobacterium perfoetens TaxID=852 RepID=UPI000487B01D|nr:NAD(P)H-dependent glycerol-3-phosphate dehydrogenase [Fusobacterium perfoetens]MCI6152390.1 NAD(P)H-dependent glycerol-3-phosphate dehydrogenase [Fusobacterium perfoetens]MDY3236989.1 NAD(P)H-dependent glycerol-3-phosphate dehydrogenase [Fusobacterium perfoetens]